MRVLQVGRKPTMGGAQSVSVDFSNWLAARGHEVHYLAPSGGVLWDRLSSEVERTPLAGRGLATYSRAVAALARNLDVVHVHWRREALAALYARARWGTATLEHAHVDLPSKRLPALSFRADAVAAVSPEVAAMVVHGFGRPRSRVHVVGNTAPWNEHVLLEMPATRQRNLRILGVGRLAEQKDPLRWIRICAQVLAKEPDATAQWFGDGALLTACRDLVADLGFTGRIQFDGAMPDVHEELRGAGVLLMTSRWEGLSLALLEAMAAAVPVVSTDVSGARWALGRGWVPESTTDDRSLVETVLEGLHADSLGLSLRERYLGSFSRDTVYLRLEQLLMAVAAGRQTAIP